jgi:quaternary ammonium compound-resistance protein SugE
VAWIYLLVAGLFEIGYTTAIRYTDGFTKIVPVAIFVLCLALSLYCFERSTHGIPLGTAYAIWGGIGVAGTAIVGVVAYQEPLTAARAFFILTLIGSIIGLKLVTHP